MELKDNPLSQTDACIPSSFPNKTMTAHAAVRGSGHDSTFDDEESDDGWIEDSDEDVSTTKPELDEPDTTACPSRDAERDHFNCGAVEASGANHRKEVERKQMNIKEEVEDDEIPLGQSFVPYPYSDKLTESQNVLIKKEKVDDDFLIDPLSHSSCVDVRNDGSNKPLKTERELDVIDEQVLKEQIQITHVPKFHPGIKFKPDDSMKHRKTNGLTDSKSRSLIGNATVSQLSCDFQLDGNGTSAVYPLKFQLAHDGTLTLPGLGDIGTDVGSSTDRTSVTKYSCIDEYVAWLAVYLLKGNKKNVVLKGPTNLINDVTKRVNERIKSTQSNSRDRSDMQARMTIHANKPPVTATKISQSMEKAQLQTTSKRIQKPDLSPTETNTALVNRDERQRHSLVGKDSSELNRTCSTAGSGVYIVNHRAQCMQGVTPRMKPVQFCVKAPEKEAGQLTVPVAPLGLPFIDTTRRPILPKTPLRKAQSNAASRPAPNSVRLNGSVNAGLGDSANADDAGEISRNNCGVQSLVSQTSSAHMKAMDRSRKSFVYVLKDGQSVLVPSTDKFTNNVVWRSSQSFSTNAPVRVKFLGSDDGMQDAEKRFPVLPLLAVKTRVNSEGKKDLTTGEGKSRLTTGVGTSWEGDVRPTTGKDGACRADVTTGPKTVPEAPLVVKKPEATSTITQRRSGRERKVNRPYSPPPAKKRRVYRALSGRDDKEALTVPSDASPACKIREEVANAGADAGRVLKDDMSSCDPNRTQLSTQRKNADANLAEGKTITSKDGDDEKSSSSEDGKFDTLSRNEKMRQLQKRIEEQERELELMKKKRQCEIARRKTNPDLLDLY